MAGFFYYVTYKYVLLKDARLGVLYYLLAALILLYTVVEIFVRKGYMQVSLKQQLWWEARLILPPPFICAPVWYKATGNSEADVIRRLC